MQSPCVYLISNSSTSPQIKISIPEYASLSKRFSHRTALREESFEAWITSNGPENIVHARGGVSKCPGEFYYFRNVRQNYSKFKMIIVIYKNILSVHKAQMIEH